MRWRCVTLGVLVCQEIHILVDLVLEYLNLSNLLGFIVVGINSSQDNTHNIGGSLE